MTSVDNQRVFEAHYRKSSYRPKPGFFAALKEARLAMLRQLPTTSRVLDLGCGSGTFLLPLHQDGYRTTGLDYSATILADLRDEAEAQGIHPQRLDLVQGDARAMPLPDASFDAVFSFATLYAIPEIERVLAEIARVLRPGGRAFLELGNARSLNAIEATRIGNGLHCLHLSPGRMRHLLRTAGLAVQQVRSFQLFPYWGGGTARARDLLNPVLAQALAAPCGDTLLDERISSSPWLQPFAFRQLWCVAKGPAEAPPVAVPELPAETEALRERRRAAAEATARGDVEQAIALLLQNLAEAPDDPRAALDLARLYDGAEEQRLVRRWRRVLTRSGRLPAEGTPLTAASHAPSQPKISVVLPTFDAAHQLPEAVQSLFEQTFGDFELIVVDDGSRDDTWRYLQRLHDPRVQILRQQNQRLPTALNRGFQLARGELRSWISADNVCLPTMLAELVAALDGNPDAQLAVAGFQRVDARLGPRGVVAGQDVSFAGFLPRNPGVAAFAYRANTARLAGDYEPTLEGAEDWDYWLRLCEHGPAVAVPDVLYLYREHARSMSNTIPDRVRTASERTFQRVLERHGGLPPLHVLCPSAAGDPALAADVWFRLGTQLLESPFAPPRLAVQALQNALRSDPTDGRSYVQLAVALARAGARAEAAQIARRFATAADAGLRHLAALLQRLASGDATVRVDELPLLPCEAALTGAGSGGSA